MSIAGTHFDAAVESLSRRIVEAEMRSTAAADALSALIRTDTVTIEAERCFAEEMTMLLVLRRQLLELRSSEGA
jgi:hypothetical protein